MLCDLVCCRRLLVFIHFSSTCTYGVRVCSWKKKELIIETPGLRLIIIICYYICFIVAASCMWITIKIKLLSQRTLRNRLYIKEPKRQKRKEGRRNAESMRRRRRRRWRRALTWMQRRTEKATIKGNKIHVLYEIRRKHNIKLKTSSWNAYVRSRRQFNIGWLEVFSIW